MNLFTKQKKTHRHRKQIQVIKGGEGINQVKMNIHTNKYKIGNQQGPMVQHRGSFSVFCNNLYRKVI